MGQFLETERPRQAAFKSRSLYFSEFARADGIYRGKYRPFCLPRENAEENLFEEIRTVAPRYFQKQEIKWHHGRDNKPSNHLCDSQVCCVNFLFPFADKPHALIELLRPVFPTILRVLPMEKEFPGQFISFEWIGKENYLQERIGRGGKRTRGANFTSADAAVMFEREDGMRQIALIEWKYTESYGSTPLKIAPSGTDRTKIYKPLYEQEDCPLNESLLRDFADLFYEPFYQLMRQQLLAHEMERAHELGATLVSVLHIAPWHNQDFRRVTSPNLCELGVSAMDVWKRLVQAPDRFTSVSTEELFGRLAVEHLPQLSAWWGYINQRYSWLPHRTKCSICNVELDDPEFASNYPNFVCRECDARALNGKGEPPHHDSMHDNGDNPVFIDDIKCWRRYRFGGYITMRDKFDCADILEFYARYKEVF